MAVDRAARARARENFTIKSGFRPAIKTAESAVACKNRTNDGGRWPAGVHPGFLGVWSSRRDGFQERMASLELWEGRG